MISRFTSKDKVYQELLLLTANDEFMKDVNKLRKKCEKESEYFLDENKEKFFADYSQTNNYQKDVEELRDKYKLSRLYQFPLYMFCDGKGEMPDLRSLKGLWKTDKLERVYTLKDPGVLIDWAEIDPSFPLKAIESQLESHVVLKIYPETTKKDFIEAWPKISKERDRLFGIESIRNSKRANLTRDLFIHKLKNKGKTCVEITKTINGDERFKKQKISYEEVSKIIQRLKKRAKRLGATKKT